MRTPCVFLGLVTGQAVQPLGDFDQPVDIGDHPFHLGLGGLVMALAEQQQFGLVKQGLKRLINLVADSPLPSPWPNQLPRRKQRGISMEMAISASRQAAGNETPFGGSRRIESNLSSRFP